jgi:hydroxymethylglutaryl-CoA reductase (NADPH)
MNKGKDGLAQAAKQAMTDGQLTTAIPTKWIGPMMLKGNAATGEFSVPLATYESPLWPSTDRGARISRHCGGISCTIIDDKMTRSIAVRAKDAAGAHEVWQSIQSKHTDIQHVIEGTGRFIKFLDMTGHIVGNILYIRFECTCGDAAGHNMVTKAADAALSWILDKYTELEYSTISGNICTDKKVSAINGLNGRGKYVVADITISRKICEKMLRTKPEKIVKLNVEKNLIGSIVAGSLRSANAHFANMLLAFYLATGQDAANIIEGSQGIVHCEVTDEGDLYFSVTLPNLIVGAIGNGKDLPHIQDNLRQMECLEQAETGANARKLAALCAATVLCGELSLMAAQTNPGELVRTHMVMERKS